MNKRPKMENGCLVFYDTKGNKQLRGPGVDILYNLNVRKWTVDPPVVAKEEEAVKVEKKIGRHKKEE